MTIARWIIAAVFIPSFAQADLPENAWSRIGSPTQGVSRAIGGPANGCLSGAAELPIDGTGYEAIRLSRKRYFGHRKTIDFIETLGRRAQKAGLSIFYVGDMAQPRGGPLPFGHASHQTGLDVDIWFTANTKPNLPPGAREDVDLPSMLLSNLLQPDPARFGPAQVKLLSLAASDPAIDRIFVNPAIKLALCHGYGRSADEPAGWLHRLSAWWRHDDHFHVRLHCPDGEAGCIPQGPVPDGDGCDAGLENWAHHQTLPASTAGTQPRKKMPDACIAVLAAP